MSSMPIVPIACTLHIIIAYTKLSCQSESCWPARPKIKIHPLAPSQSGNRAAVKMLIRRSKNTATTIAIGADSWYYSFFVTAVKDKTQNR